MMALVLEMMKETIWTMSLKVMQMLLTWIQKLKVFKMMISKMNSISEIQVQNKTMKSKNCCSNKSYSPQLVEKNGCWKLKEWPINLKSIKLEMMEKNGEPIWTKPKSIMNRLKEVFQRSEANWKGYLKMSLRLLRRLAKKNKY